MAGDWIKFEVATPDKPEVYQLADLANIDPDAAVGKLLRVWSWFDQQTENGNAPSVTKKLLDRSVCVTGFCDFMISVGWMDECEGVIHLSNFERHNGKTAKNRALTAKRVAKHKGKGNAEGNGQSVSGALPREDNREDIKDPSTSPEFSDDPAPEPEEPKTKPASNVPIQQIIETYHEKLPEWPRVRVKPSGLDGQLRARWKAKEFDLGSLERWEKLFDHVRKSDFLMGRTDNRNSKHANWRPDLLWLTKPSTINKLIEGNYHAR